MLSRSAPRLILAFDWMLTLLYCRPTRTQVFFAGLRRFFPVKSERSLRELDEIVERGDAYTRGPTGAVLCCVLVLLSWHAASIAAACLRVPLLRLACVCSMPFRPVHHGSSFTALATSLRVLILWGLCD